MEKESHLSVLPYLMMETANDSENGQFRIEIYNYGVGPAIIQKRQVLYKGKTYEMEFPDFLNEVFPHKMDSINLINTSTLQPGLAIPAGQHRTVLVAGGGKESYIQFLKLMNDIQNPDNQFNYVLQYKSIFEDNWRINAIDEVPVAIE